MRELVGAAAARADWPVWLLGWMWSWGVADRFCLVHSASFSLRGNGGLLTQQLSGAASRLIRQMNLYDTRHDGTGHDR